MWRGRWFEADVKKVVPKPAKFVIFGVSGQPRGNFSKSSFGESWGPGLFFWGGSGSPGAPWAPLGGSGRSQGAQLAKNIDH